MSHWSEKKWNLGNILDRKQTHMAHNHMPLSLKFCFVYLLKISLWCVQVKHSTFQWTWISYFGRNSWRVKKMTQVHHMVKERIFIHNRWWYKMNECTLRYDKHLSYYTTEIDHIMRPSDGNGQWMTLFRSFFF